MRADRGVPLECCEMRRQAAVASWVMRAFVGVVAALVLLVAEGAKDGVILVAGDVEVMKALPA